MKTITISFLLCFILLFQNRDDNVLLQKEKTFYWFYLKLGISFNMEKNTEKMRIKKMSNAILSGTYEQFIEQHKEGLDEGQVFIGPFADKNEAIRSRQLYLNSKGKIGPNTDSIEGEDTISTCYYYMIRPLLGKLMFKNAQKIPLLKKLFKPLSYQRIPSRIASGTQMDYISTLEEGLGFDFLTIGPFSDYALAEKSKFIFRKNGEPGSELNIDSSALLSIKDMSKKWKSVKVEMLKSSKKRNTNKITYTLKVRFPKNYFIEDAFQTITIEAKYSDTLCKLKTGVTFQGDYVMDNNEIVPFDKLFTYTQTIDVASYKNVKLKGFTIESFIFNSKEMIDQENKYLVAK